jgi:hypothetical protein
LLEPFSLGNGFGRDAENGNRDGRAPQQCPSRAANGSLRWTNGAKGVSIGDTVGFPDIGLQGFAPKLAGN